MSDQAEIVKVEEDLPRKLRLLLNEQKSKITKELAYWLALHDSELLRAIKEDEICEKFSITKEQLRSFRNSHRLDVEKCKDEIYSLKRKMHLEVNDRLALLQGMRESMLAGDKDKAKLYREALSVSEGLVPAESLEQYAKLLEKTDDRQPESKGGASIQINVGQAPQMEDATEKLRKLKEAKKAIIDIGPPPIMTDPPV